MSSRGASFRDLPLSRSLLQDILSYAATPLGTLQARRELCRLSRVCKKWKRAAHVLMLETLDDDGDAELFARLLDRWKRGRTELTTSTKRLALRENWKTQYKMGVAFLTEARRVNELTIGFTFFQERDLNNKALANSLASLRVLTCDFSNHKIVQLLYALKNLKTLRLLQHAERNWAPLPRRPPFELESLTLWTDSGNPSNPGFTEWLLSSSRKSIKSLYLSTSYGIEVLRALRCLDRTATLRHLRLERLNVWPCDMIRNSPDHCEDAELEDMDTLVDVLPKTLVRLGLSPVTLKTGGIDDLALGLLDKIPELPELKVIDLGGRLLAPCEGRPIETTVFYERCAKEGVRVQAWSK